MQSIGGFVLNIQCGVAHVDHETVLFTNGLLGGVLGTYV